MLYNERSLHAIIYSYPDKYISHSYQRGNHNFETKTNLSIEVHLECITLIGTQRHAISICGISIKCT